MEKIRVVPQKLGSQITEYGRRNQQLIVKLVKEMRLQEVKTIKTNITSSIDVSIDERVFSLVTRKLATKNAKYQYQLSMYDLKNFQKIITTPIYETYSQQSHPTKILNDGKTVVVATKFHVIFYDRQTLQVKFKTLHGQSNVYDLQGSHDGRVVAMVGDNIVKMWNSANFKSIQFPFLITTARRCNFSYDNKYFGVSSTTVISVYEIIERNAYYEFVTRFTTPERVNFGTISSFKFNPLNSDQVAVGFSNISPRLYTFSNNDYETILKGDNDVQQPEYFDNYKQVAYLPDGFRIISSDYSEGVGLWPGVSGALFYKENYLYFGVHPFASGSRALGYVWQQVKILQIQIKCGNKYLNSCPCRNNQIWSEKKYRCQNNNENNFDCRVVEFSNGVKNGRKCVCLKGYYFDSLSRKCLLDCKKVQNTIPVSPASQLQCFCKPGFFWNETNKSCQFECSDVIFTTGSVDSDGNCECIVGWVFEPETKTCACLPYSVRNFDGTCSCISGYILNPAINKCVVDCSTLFLENSSGKNEGDQKCECNEGYYFGVYINSDLDETVGCRRNCSQIINAIETIGLNECLCEENMDWVENACRVNCTTIKNAVPGRDQIEFNNETNQLQVICKCSTNFEWVKENRECGRNCSNQLYVDKNLISTALACPCINNFEWDIYNMKCKIDCQEVDFTQSYSIKNNYSCECKQFFLWDKNDYSCKINCSEIYDADKRISDGTCSCKNDKKFNSTGMMCQQTNIEEALNSPWFIAVLAVGVVFVIVVGIIMIKFCCKFSTQDNKQHNKRLKTSLDPPKQKKKKNNKMTDEDLRSAQRMSTNLR